jgi:hypothetical protein
VKTKNAEEEDQVEDETSWKKKYLPRDDSVIDPEYRTSKRIIVDADFHFFRDRYGLTNPTFNSSELEEILIDVTRTWMRANIWIRFKRLPPQGEMISDRGADAMRWWVFAYKDAKANKTRFWNDVKLFLKNGASKMTGEEAEKDVLKRYNEFGGHSLMNWILNVGRNDQSRAIKIDAYTVGFWPW